MHLLAWKKSVHTFPSQRRVQGPRSAPTSTFWVLSMHTHRCHWDFGSLSVPEHLRLRRRASELSHAFSRTPKQMPLAETHTKKVFPDCTDFRNQWELQPLHANRGCPRAPFCVQAMRCQPFFLEEKAVAEKQENLDFVPTSAPWCSLSCSSLPHLLWCMSSWRGTISG